MKGAKGRETWIAMKGTKGRETWIHIVATIFLIVTLSKTHTLCF